MKWIINNEGYVVDVQTGDVQCLLAKNEDKLRDKVIEAAPELFAAIFSFVETMDSGKSSVRSSYNEFKEILERFPPELLHDLRIKNVA